MMKNTILSAGAAKFQCAPACFVMLIFICQNFLILFSFWDLTLICRFAMCGFLFVMGRTAMEKEIACFYELERQ